VGFQSNGDNDSLTPNRGKRNSHQRILVVDDETVIRQLNSKVLILSRYEVDTAEDGGAAWDALQAVGRMFFQQRGKCRNWDFERVGRQEPNND
jgi:hypothetical protein